MEFDDVEEEMETRHAVITAKIFEFSNKCIHLPGKEVKTEYTGLEKLLSPYRTHYLKIFANGRTETDEGYVSITFDCGFARFFHRGCCIISVVDAYGNQRFTETFSFFNEPLVSGDSTHSSTSFHIDRYLSRARLINDRNELLPNNVLTLLIDVYFTELTNTVPEVPLRYKDVSWFESCFQYDEARQPKKLLLDSPLAERLTKESIVFQKMLENPMAEERTKIMTIDMKDYIPFKHIGDILMGEMTVIFKTMKDIFDTYIVADRYCIPAVTETCTAFLKLCLSDHTVDEYFELANEYEAEGLKELLRNEINLMKKTNFEAEIKKLKNGAVLKLPIRKCLWRYFHPKRKTIFLAFLNVTEPSCLLYGKETFNFYK